MVIKKYSQSHRVHDAMKKIDVLRRKSRELFLDHIMHDVNDALTSVLAICDTEAPNATPRIKKHIDRINQALYTAKDYHTGVINHQSYRLNLAVDSVFEVMQDNTQIKFTKNCSIINASAIGDQKSFENLLISCLLILKTAGNKINCQLLQNGTHVNLSLKGSPFSLESIESELIQKFTIDFHGELITDEKKGEFILRMPIAFDVKPEINITFSTQVNEKKPAYKLVNGAQERI